MLRGFIMGTMHEGNGRPGRKQLGELSDHECYLRLAATHLGRVALSVGALPRVFPVHYALLGRDPVFRTDVGAKLSAAAQGNVVCLEIDDAVPEYHTGWSVMVIGPADILVDPADLAAAARLPLNPWVGGGDSFVRVAATLVSGREILPSGTPSHARPTASGGAGAPQHR